MPREKVESMGPGWWDVAAQMADLYKRYGERISFQTSTNAGRDGRWGLHVCVRDRVSGTFYGSCAYGPSSHNGAKTMAAAWIHAMIAAERYLEMYGLWGAGNPHFDKLQPSEDELPF